jgi:hypothetical protein
VIIKQLQSEFGRYADLSSAICGMIHEYLGMTLDFNGQSKHWDGEKYLDRLMQDLPEDMIDHATTPKAAHLFYTRAGAMKLSDQDKGLFHM